jgi:hypothetical protein
MTFPGAQDLVIGRHRAVRKAILTLVFCLITVVLTSPIAFAIDTSQWPQPVWWAAAAGLAGSIITAVAVLIRFKGYTRSSLTILWIRKFHRVEEGQSSWLPWRRRRSPHRSSRNLQVVLEAACLGSGHLITLGDPDVHLDSNSRRERSYGWGVVVSVLLSGAAFLQGEGGWSLILIPVFICLQIAARRRWRRPITVSAANYRQTVVGAIRCARADQAKSPSTVLLCPKEGEFWTEVVAYLSDKVDIVVISAAEASGKIDHEVELLLKTVGHARMVFLTNGRGARPANLPDTVLTVTIPEKVGWWPFKKEYENIAIAVGTIAQSVARGGGAG